MMYIIELETFITKTLTIRKVSDASTPVYLSTHVCINMGYIPKYIHILATYLNTKVLRN